MATFRLGSAIDPIKTLEFWRDNLECWDYLRDVGATTEYLARCPAHPDVHPSLVVLHEVSNPTNPVRCHCRAGCAFEDIVHLLRERAEQQTAVDEDREMTPPLTTGHDISSAPSFFEATQYSPIYQLAGYCGVSYAWLRDHPHLALAENPATGLVYFVFEGVEGERPGYVAKWRKMPPTPGVKEKEVGWHNMRQPRPPLYPIAPKELPEEIAMTEGETDCILARYWGFEAYSLTAGGGTPFDVAAMEELHRRGVKRIIIFSDIDPTGQSCRDGLVRLCLDVGITPVPVDLRLLGDILLGGHKDLRDFRHMFPGEDGREKAHQAIRDVIAQSESRLDEIIPSFEDAYAKRMPDPGWLCEDWTAPGVLTLLVGKPGLGKSSILLGYAKAARDGAPLLGKEVRKHSILLCTEEGVRSLWKKRELTGPLPNVRLHSVDYEGLDEDWAEQVRIVGDVARRHNIDVIVFDTLWSHACVSETVDEDKSSSIRPIFRKLRALTRAGHAVMVTTHARKSGGSGGDQVAGSIAIPGEVDVVVEIVPSPDGEVRHRQISWVKSRLNSDIVGTPPVTITIDGADLILVDDGTGTQNREKKIKEFLSDGQWHSAADIGSFVGATQDALRRPLDSLCHHGILDKEKCDGTNGRRGTWRYRMPQKIDLSGLIVR